MGAQAINAKTPSAQAGPASRQVKPACGEEQQDAEEARDSVQGEQRIRAGDFVPEIGGEDVEKACGREDHGRQFLLPFDVMFGEVGITGDAVIDQVGDVIAIKTFIEADPCEAGGG